MKLEVKFPCGHSIVLFGYEKGDQIEPSCTCFTQAQGIDMNAVSTPAPTSNPESAGEKCTFCGKPKADPFANAEPWVKYQATDADGSVFNYATRPFIHERWQGWVTPDSTGALRITEKGTTPCPDWRNSLIERKQ